MGIAKAEQALSRTFTAGAEVGGQGGKIILLIEHGIHHFWIESTCAMTRPS
ncbi:hypothetical protein D3C76_1639520 [compost metagenome]